MSTYRAPLAEMHFVLTEIAGIDQVGRCRDSRKPAGRSRRILEELAKFATNVLDPLNISGDREGSRRLDDGTVKTPAGFKDAYLQFCENGWNGLTKSTDFGGQGLPHLVGTAVEEMWHSSNLAFNLCPLLTQGAIRRPSRGTQALKDTYLPNMVSGSGPAP
jgi:alkylation response protein AidB-like acyl-CoA dehydrogenase